MVQPYLFGEPREDRLAFLTPKRAERVPKRILFRERRYVQYQELPPHRSGCGTGGARPRSTRRRSVTSPLPTTLPAE